jgi:HK97 gp10 family phage protein
MARTTITGLARLNDKFQRMVATAVPDVRVGVAEGASLIVAEQQRLAPVKTGALRASVQWTFGDPPQGTRLGGGKRSASETRATITAGSTRVPYAAFVEFGTRHAPAQPFFYPGYRATRRQAKAAIRKAVAASVRQAAA